ELHDPFEDVQHHLRLADDAGYAAKPLTLDEPPPHEHHFLDVDGLREALANAERTTRLPAGEIRLLEKADDGDFPRLSCLTDELAPAMAANLAREDHEGWLPRHVGERLARGKQLDRVAR